MPRYDFGSGRPDPASFPTEKLAEAAGRAILRLGGDLVLYPGDKGDPGLREVMAARESEREGVEVSPEQIVLTNGSMQAVTLVAEALLERPGDLIVLEELNYPGTLAAYRRLGARLIGVPIDGKGMRIDSLEEILADLHRKGTSPRFIYTLTTYHNPTGAVMPRERRLRLIETARRYGTIVVEDNCYGDVHFEGRVEPALYALDDGADLVYLCSLSKILGAGIRLGYLVARSPLMERILDRRYDGGNSVLAAAICAEFLRDRLWEHVEKTCSILREKRDALLEALEENLGGLCTWSKPTGGLFVWVGFPREVDPKELWNLAEKRGIAYARGAGFHVRNEEIPFLRLAFGYPSLEEIREGIQMLGACIREALTRSSPSSSPQPTGSPRPP